MADEKPEACTTWSYRLQHLSLNLLAGRKYGRQVARTLCNQDAWSQIELDTRAQLHGTTSKRRVADLPQCKKCAAKAVKL